MEQPAGALVDEAFLEVGGVRIRYLHAGTAGPPVVLLHGGGVDAAHLSWKHTVESLGTTHRVFAPDLPGYGDSDAPDDEYSTSYFTSFLDSFLDSLDLEETSLVGLSIGGAIALSFALRAPERVDDLVLVDSYGLANEPPRGIGSMASPFTWSALRHNRSLVRWGLQELVADSRTITSELVDEAHGLLERPHAGRAFRRFYRNEIGRSGVQSDFSDRLNAVSQPTLLVHGVDDDIISAEWSNRAADRIPDARLAVLEECGHWPPRERPSEFNRIVSNFLARERQSNIPVER